MSHTFPHVGPLIESFSFKSFLLFKLLHLHLSAQRPYYVEQKENPTVN